MEELPSRRHPEVVSRDGAFTTAAQDYVPPPELDTGPIAGHPWGTRTIRMVREQTQYMVYDRKGRNVLSCCPTPEMAAKWAVERLAREAKPPSDYSHRLEGMRFGHRSDDQSVVLVHTILDADGREVAASTDGRAAAAAKAVKALVSRNDCLDATREEFASTLVFAQVTKGIGRKSLPVVYNNSEGQQDQSAVRKELMEIWRANPALQVDRHDVPESLYSSHPAKFVDRAQGHLLRTAARLGGSVALVVMNFADTQTSARFVFHDGRFDRAQMVDHLYAQYLQDVAALQERSSPVPRPVA